MHRALTSIRLLAVLLIAAAALPALASASADEIFADCQDGRLDKKYSGQDLRSALSDIPVDLDEYSSCRELIRSAQQGVRSSGGSGPGSNFNGADGYGALPAGEGGLPLGPDSKPIDPAGIATEAERKELEAARTTAPVGAGSDKVGAGIVDIGAAKSAGESPTKASGAELPTSLIVLLALVAGALLATAAPRLKGLVLRRSS